MFEKYLYDGTEKFDIHKVSTDETSLASSKEEAKAKMKENETELD